MRHDAAGCRIVALDPVADIRTSAATRAVIAEALLGDDPVVIDCSGIRDADLTLIQVLLAARASARRKGVSLTVRYPVPSPLHDLLVRGGFIDAGGADPANDEFWMAGGA